MFAALAEVSGTIVLPLLEKETQAVFVWFLILFPCILVGSFFGTLLFKHHVLYAPSDYKDEKFFFDLFSPADKKDIIKKLNSESEADYPLALPDDPDLEQSDAPNFGGGVRNAGGAVVDIPTADPPALPPKTEPSTSPSRPPADVAFTYGASARRVEELVISKIEESLGIPLRREVSPSGMPGTVFDAVGEASGRSVIVEVRYTRIGHVQTPQVESLLLKVEKFWTRLPENIQAGFQLIYVVVVDGASQVRIDMMRKTFLRHARYYPYKVRFIMMSVDQLDNDDTEILSLNSNLIIEG